VSDYAPSFGSVAETYERARPRTGKLTQQLVARGVDVVALEPDPDMRAVLRRVLPDVELHEGFAEDIPLADASVDAITVGQAFHWFDGERPPFGERPGIAEKRSFRQRRPMTVDAIVEGPPRRAGSSTRAVSSRSASCARSGVSAPTTPAGCRSGPTFS